jgi:pimeloyl-ACP methyl ester carboxylesterase
VCHGNAGQASQRGYIADCLPGTDSVYVLEYPGYGKRAGTPSLASINAAATAAYAALRREHPSWQIAVLGESLGSGPAAYLCSLADPPGRAVLIVPFDDLLSVAKEHLPFLPVSLLMRDKWNNAACLSQYTGRIDIYGATLDEVIPAAHARNLARSLPAARYHEINCGHNDWSALVRIEN